MVLVVWVWEELAMARVVTTDVEGRVEHTDIISDNVEGGEWYTVQVLPNILPSPGKLAV